MGYLVAGIKGPELTVVAVSKFNSRGVSARFEVSGWKQYFSVLSTLETRVMGKIRFIYRTLICHVIYYKGKWCT